jgi:uncharacterized protein
LLFCGVEDVFAATIRRNPALGVESSVTYGLLEDLRVARLQVKAKLWLGQVVNLVAAVFLFVLPLSTFAGASDQDAPEGASGFADYLPAAPEIKLPKIDIPFWTSDIKKARRAYRAGNYERALKFFREESDEGNVVADWYLAHMFRLGQGVQRDPSVAYSYYSRVSESYDPDEDDKKRLRIAVDSQVHMAHYLRVGIKDAGLQANPQGAARAYLRLASNYGHPAAQFALGEMNIMGQGMKKNPQQGLKWITAAARKRHPDAQAYLGDLYWTGSHVKRNEARAVMWYILAAETALPEEDPEIFDRYNELMATVDGDVRLEAEARAKVWAEQFPAESEN